MAQRGIIAYIVLFVLLIVGIVIGVYLVQHPQIFRPKASEGNQIIPVLEMKDSQGKEINCDASVNPPSCETETQDITIKVRDWNTLIK